MHQIPFGSHTKLTCAWFTLCYAIRMVLLACDGLKNTETWKVKRKNSVARVENRALATWNEQGGHKACSGTSDRALQSYEASTHTGQSRDRCVQEVRRGRGKAHSRNLWLPSLGRSIFIHFFNFNKILTQITIKTNGKQGNWNFSGHWTGGQLIMFWSSWMFVDRYLSNCAIN